MVQSKKKYKQLKLNKKILLYFFIPLTFVIVGFYIGRNTAELPMSKANKPVSYTCPSFESYKKEKFLEHYQVQEGDTLLSISTSVLKDSSRVSELIAFNQEKYPELTLNKPFLEVGWDLLLPPKNIVISGSDFSNLSVFTKTNGSLVSIEDSNGFWWISNGNSKYVVKPNSETKFIGVTKSDIKVGDCLTFVLLGTKEYTVELQ